MRNYQSEEIKTSKNQLNYQSLLNAQPEERIIIGQLEAVSFGDTTCEACVLADGMYKDFVIEMGMIQHQLQMFGDVSQMFVEQNCCPKYAI